MKIIPDMNILCMNCKWVKKEFSTQRTVLTHKTALCSHKLSVFSDPVNGLFSHGNCTMARSQEGHCGPGGMSFIRK